MMKVGEEAEGTLDLLFEICGKEQKEPLHVRKGMVLQDQRLLAAQNDGTVQTDSLYAGLGAFDAASGVMFMNGDEASGEGQKATWVVDALREGTTESSTELPQEVLRWLLADPLFVLSRHDPGPRVWRREELHWETVHRAEAEDGRDDTEEPFIHTAVAIDRRLSFGRMARYRLHRFVAKDATAMNEAIKASQRVQQRSDPVLSSNFGGYHSKRDLFRSDDAGNSGIEDFILAAVKAIERRDRAMWEEDGEPPEVYNEPVKECMEGWVNVSGAGDLNTLHHHSGATWSGAYYVDTGKGDVDGFTGGNLLLRFTRGMTYIEDTGQGNMEPDEDLHVPRMQMMDGTTDPEGPEKEAAEFDHFGRYAHVEPEPGTLIIFPAWLSHAVAPHLGNSDRISVSFNVFLY